MAKIIGVMPLQKGVQTSTASTSKSIDRAGAVENVNEDVLHLKLLGSFGQVGATYDEFKGNCHYID